MRMNRTLSSALLVAGWLGVTLGAGQVGGQALPPGFVPPLSSIPVPRPPNLGDFIRDEQAARVLGKALFWDMQVGSDGVQACATCHFNAGADSRTKNQVSPGLLRVAFKRDNGTIVAEPDADLDFDGQGPNYTLRKTDFPLRKLSDPTDRESPPLAHSNNVVASQGVHYEIHGASGRPEPDPANFRVGAANVRRVEPRNTPTIINGVFNFRNFWDGRADNVFNGVSPFGPRDTDASLYRVDGAGVLSKVTVALINSSLASQAVGPPTNPFEMSADGRPFPIVGRSLTLELRRRHRLVARRLKDMIPLAGQLVHPNDSLLGPYSRWPRPGLTIDYDNLIRRAFQPRWWASLRLIRVDADGNTTVVTRPDNNPQTNEYRLLEYNFSLFFGLAVQAYEATLVSDQTPFDRFMKNPATQPLSAAAERGRRIFFNLDDDASGLPRGNCLFCHSGTLFTEASVDSVASRGLIRDSGGQLSDTGTRSIGVTPTTEDLGFGGLDPFGGPLSIAVGTAPPGSILAADGTFKIPGLRNVALTAPYFHNGGFKSLAEVVDFYARGGNQGGLSNPILTRDGTEIGGLSILNFNTGPHAASARADLVAFLESLTDERVRNRAAPFDHPQLFVPHGHPGDKRSVKANNGQALDALVEIPAVGRNGGTPLLRFLKGERIAGQAAGGSSRRGLAGADRGDARDTPPRRRHEERDQRREQ